MDRLLDIVLSNKQSFALTLRKTTKPWKVTRSDYLDHINKICEQTGAKLVRYCFEQTAGLHMHGVIEMEYGTNHNLFRVRGWHCKLVEIWNLDGWNEYMMKENYEEEMIEEIHPVYRIKRSLFRDSDSQRSSVGVD